MEKRELKLEKDDIKELYKSYMEIVSLIELLIFSLGHFASLKVEFNVILLLLFLMCFSALIFVLISFKTYKLSTKEFKKQRKISWTACILTFIYWLYLLVVFAMKKYTNQAMAFGHLIILGGAILLMVIGNSMRILDESIEYQAKNLENENKN